MLREVEAGKYKAGSPFRGETHLLGTKRSALPVLQNGHTMQAVLQEIGVAHLESGIRPLPSSPLSLTVFCCSVNQSLYFLILQMREERSRKKMTECKFKFQKVFGNLYVSGQ